MSNHDVLDYGLLIAVFALFVSIIAIVIGVVFQKKNLQTAGTINAFQILGNHEHRQDRMLFSQDFMSGIEQEKIHKHRTLNLIYLI